MKISIKKGLDLPLAGAYEGDPKTVADVAVETVAIIPDDFPGFIPKVDVKPGDVVEAGDALMHHKNSTGVKLVSPVSGVVDAVERGERRKVLSVKVKADGRELNKKFDTKASEDAEGIVALLSESGLLAMMRRRPYDIVPDPAVLPRDIFVTAFDSAPLAVNAPAGDKAVYEAAVAWLAKVTTGKVYISRREGQNFPDVSGAVTVDVKGPHPAGLVGVQIANIKPVNKGETVWTLNADTLYKIGTIATTGSVDWHTRVAVVGSSVQKPYVARTVCGAAVEPLLKGHVDGKEHLRIIAGNVLTGVKIAADGYLHYPYSQITVIPEGDDVDQFMGWASLSPKMMSVSPSYPGSWFKRLFAPDARVKGGRRAMIMSGIYDKYLPMDIMAEYLLKAIEARNIDSMEKLGIYEVAPEDFALAEYADSSKLPLQHIVREGLDYLRAETE